MGKARMLGYNKPYIPNNRADRKRGNPFSGKTGLVVKDECTRFTEKEWLAAKKITTKEKRP
jgi:hypothetical protein